MRDAKPELAGFGAVATNQVENSSKNIATVAPAFCVLHPSPLEVFMTAAVRFVSLAVCFVALAGCDIAHLVAQSERARGSFERTLTVDGPVDLSVRSGSGGIQIRTGSGDRVQVIGKVSAGSSRDGLDPAERVRKVEAAPPITQEGNVIRIGETNDDPTYRNVSISYELVVPANTRLDAQTGSGSQTIGSVNGAVRAQTGSGSIRIERTGGSLFAQTGSGNIHADAVGGDVRAQTGSGSVEVRQIDARRRKRADRIGQRQAESAGGCRLHSRCADRIGIDFDSAPTDRAGADATQPFD